jgi:Family of unknown function (DUF6325)
MTLGPVQMLVVGFEDPQFKGEILAELTRLKEADIVRLLDVAVVKKNEDESVEILHASDLGDVEYGAAVGALIGIGVEDTPDAPMDSKEVWYAADAIPPGTATAIALIEHRWAIPLRDTVTRAGGFVLADEWIHSEDLVAAGVGGAEKVEAGKSG